MILAQDQEGLRHGLVGPGQDDAPTRRRSSTPTRCIAFRDRFALPLSDDDVEALRFLPARGHDSAEMQYLHAQRALGGYLPARAATARATVPVPPLAAFARLLEGSHGARAVEHHGVRAASSRNCSRIGELGPRVVPIVADEARTFGMQNLFRQVGIYSPVGQLYEPEDKDELLYYKEAKDGQILEEGITEAGALVVVDRRRRPVYSDARHCRCCRSTSTTRCSASSASAT